MFREQYKYACMRTEDSVSGLTHGAYNSTSNKSWTSRHSSCTSNDACCYLELLGWAVCKLRGVRSTRSVSWDCKVHRGPCRDVINVQVSWSCYSFMTFEIKYWTFGSIKFRGHIAKCILCYVLEQYPKAPSLKTMRTRWSIWCMVKLFCSSNLFSNCVYAFMRVPLRLHCILLDMCNTYIARWFRLLLWRHIRRVSYVCNNVPLWQHSTTIVSLLVNTKSQLTTFFVQTLASRLASFLQNYISYLF